MYYYNNKVTVEVVLSIVKAKQQLNKKVIRNMKKTNLILYQLVFTGL